jgi:hypothetical protein
MRSLREQCGLSCKDRQISSWKHNVLRFSILAAFYGLYERVGHAMGCEMASLWLGIAYTGKVDYGDVRYKDLKLW